jgi:predicted permease
LRQEFEAPLFLLLAMVVLVLLVACANVANLMLARSAVRQQEMAVRFAMGAGPLRIVRQLLTESLVLASLGGALGLVLARQGAVFLVNLANTDRRTVNPVALGLDWRVLGFTAIACIAAAVLFGLAPALGSVRQKRNGSLRGSVNDFGASKSRVRYILPATQIALGVLVLMAATLLVRSLQNLEQTDLGYSRDQLLMVPVDLAASGYGPAEMSTPAEELLVRLRSLPGVRSATVSCNGLFSGGESTDAALIDDTPAANDGDNVIAEDQVGPNYFSTIGASIILGREITAQDVSAASRVAVVNEAFAKFYFNERNPLGHKIYIQDSDQPNQAPYEIVGVVRDVHDHSVRGAVRRRMYAPLTTAILDQTDILNFEIRAVGNPAMLIHSVRAVIRGLNPDLVVGNIETATGLVTDSLSTQVVVANLSTFFGVLVLILVCVGLYGIMSFNVAARTREIGLRMALGALRWNLIWMVMREAWLVLVIGLAVGIPVGIAASQLFKAMLFGVNKSDPFSIATAILALMVICVTAAVVPVRRATHVDPMVALRHE